MITILKRLEGLGEALGEIAQARLPRRYRTITYWETYIDTAGYHEFSGDSVFKRRRVQVRVPIKMDK